MPFLLHIFLDDNCVARVYIRVRGSYLVTDHSLSCVLSFLTAFLIIVFPVVV